MSQSYSDGVFVGSREPSPTPPPTPPGHDDGSGSGSGTGGDLLGKLLDLDGVVGGSASLASGLIDINLDGEAGHTGALLSVVAGGEGLGDIAVNLDTDAIGDTGLLGAAFGLLGDLDSLDGVLCDCILS